MSKKPSLREAEDRAKLPVRRSPYPEPMTTTKGVALLYFAHERARKWGVKTPTGQRNFIGFEENMTYEEACTTVRAIVKAESESNTRVDLKDDGAVDVPSEKTFGEAWDQYLRWAQASGKSPEMLANLRSHGNVIEGILPRKIASTPLATLNDWRDGLIGSTGTNGRKRSVQSVARVLASLKAALNRAAVPGDWSDLKTGAKKTAPAKQIVALMDDDLQRFTDAAYQYSHDLGVFVQALALTGARPKELRLATVSDLTASGLRIRHGKTANKTGDRVIPLNGHAVAFFASLTAGKGKSGPLLGKHWTQGETRTPVENCAKAAGVPGVTLYSLRHGFVTNAIYNGVPIKSVADATGTSVAMIERTYGHTVAAKERDVWANVNPFGTGHLRAVAGGGA